MSYISLSDTDRKEMLKKAGVSSVAELFLSIPKNIRLKGDLKLPGPLTEPELMRFFEEEAAKNTCSGFLSFLGGGAYPHTIPVVVDYLSQRGEFISPYTPYQAEVSQGTLQIIFEFQTLICQLTGMDIANASLYDGASGAAEAVLMANRVKSKKKILISRSVHPHYKATIQTYVKNLDIICEEILYSDSGAVDVQELKEKLDGETAAVVCQSPNFFGVIEKLKSLSGLAHTKGALFIVIVAEPVSLGLLEAPGKLGADIVAGEGQPLGLPLSFGGPYLGFMACRNELVRQFPGRIAGQTKDVEGKRGFVLTLSTREQHIRRERATSNICTNQAWCALRATLFLETLGKEGLREMAWQNVQKAHYLLDKLKQIDAIKVEFSEASFNEFVLQIAKPWKKIDRLLRKRGIIGGFGLEEFYPELKNCVLLCVTELHRKMELDRFAEELHKAVEMA